MSNLTQDILYGNNYSQPLLPENPIRYVVDNVHFTIDVDVDTFLYVQENLNVKKGVKIVLVEYF